jgi:hypothetical protein
MLGSIVLLLYDSLLATHNYHLVCGTILGGTIELSCTAARLGRRLTLQLTCLH